jgi:alcohol dehydrogenase YqhD (iron-dependent ADH family)
MSWHWNYKNGQNAPNSKLTSMQKEVFPIYGTENKFLAIESNEQTRKMWTSLGIKSCRHDDKNLETYLSED